MFTHLLAISIVAIIFGLLFLLAEHDLLEIVLCFMSILGIAALLYLIIYGLLISLGF